MPEKVVFSDRAIVSVMNETLEKMDTETGGVFLGHRKEDVWYIIEAIDPGPRAIFKSSYFEYDQNYVNHVINRINKLYLEPLDIIGLWHRHPGSFASFSHTDNETNTEFAQLDERGAISALVCVCPDFQLNMFSVTLPLRYEKLTHVFGDKNIPGELLTYKSHVELANEISTHQANARFHIYQQVPFDKALDEYLFFHRLSVNKRKSLTMTLDSGDDSVEKILENMQPDIDFFEKIQVAYGFGLNDKGALEFRKTADMPEGGELVTLAFYRSDENQETVFTYKANWYTYSAGLFREAYKAYVLTRGGKADDV